MASVDLVAYVSGDVQVVTRLLSQAAMIFDGNDFEVAVKAVVMVGILFALFRGLIAGGKLDALDFVLPIFIIVVGIIPRVNLVIEDPNGGVSKIDDLPVLAAGPVSLITTIGAGLSNLLTDNLGLDDNAVSMQNGHIVGIRAPTAIRDVILDKNLNGDFATLSTGMNINNDVPKYVEYCIGYDQLKGIGSDYDALYEGNVDTVFAGVNRGFTVATHYGGSLPCNLYWNQIKTGLEDASFESGLSAALDKAYARYDGDNTTGDRYIAALEDMVADPTDFYKSVIFSRAIEKAASASTKAGGGGSTIGALTDALNQRRWKNYGAAAMVFETISHTMTFIEAWTLCILPLIVLMFVAGSPGIKLGAKYFWLLVWIQLWYPTILITTGIIDALSTNIDSSNTISIAATAAFLQEVYRLQDMSYLFLSMATMLSMFLIYGTSSIMASSIQRDLSATDHYDPKKNSPDSFTRAPLTQYQSAFTHSGAGGYEGVGTAAFGNVSFTMDRQRSSGISDAANRAFIATGQKVHTTASNLGENVQSSSGVTNRGGQEVRAETGISEAKNVAQTTALTGGNAVASETANSEGLSTSQGLNIAGRVSGGLGGGGTGAVVAGQASAGVTGTQNSQSTERATNSVNANEQLNEVQSVSAQTRETESQTTAETQDQSENKVLSGGRVENASDVSSETETAGNTHSVTESMSLSTGAHISVNGVGLANNIGKDETMMRDLRSAVVDTGIASSVENFMLKNQDRLDMTFKGDDKEDAMFAFSSMMVMQGLAGNPFQGQDLSNERLDALNALGDEFIQAATFAGGTPQFTDERALDGVAPLDEDLHANMDRVHKEVDLRENDVEAAMGKFEFSGDPKKDFEGLLKSVAPRLDLLTDGQASRIFDETRDNIMGRYGPLAEETETYSKIMKEHGLSGLLQNISKSAHEIDLLGARTALTDAADENGGIREASADEILEERLKAFETAGISSESELARYMALSQLEVGAMVERDSIFSLRGGGSAAAEKLAQEFSGMREELIAQNPGLSGEGEGGTNDINALSVIGAAGEQSLARIWPAAQMLYQLNEARTEFQPNGETELSGAGLEGRLLNFIGSHEAPEGYDQYYGGINLEPDKPLSEMTINEVQAWQKDAIAEQRERGIPADSRSSAAGQFQIISGTLNDLKTSMNLTGDELFDATMQNRMGVKLMEDAGLQDFKDGNLTPNAFGNNLAHVWASMPLLSGENEGQGAYDHVGNNSALTTSSEFRKAIVGSG